MARTSAKAKKQKQAVDKSKTEGDGKKSEVEEVNPTTNSEVEESNCATDKENDDSNFEVEKIIHTRIYRGKRQYLVRWKGYNENSDTWESESNLQSCKEILDSYKEKNNITNEKSLHDSDSEENYEEEGSVKDKSSAKKRKSSKGKAGGSKKKKIVSKKRGAESSEEGEKSSEETSKEKNEVDINDDKIVKGKKSKQADKKKTEESDEESDTDGKKYEVEKILEVHYRKDGRREFLIRWKGYKPSDDTWEPEAHLNCSEMIDKFMEKVAQAKKIPARELRETRTPTNRLIFNHPSKGKRTNLRNPDYRINYQE